MGQDENDVVVDVEEGEISDAASVEEISEVDFKEKEETRKSMVVGGGGGGGGGGGDTRVWTMRDLLSKYPASCRGYAASGLYNLAWAQAVQNKPLNEVFVMRNAESNGNHNIIKSKEPQDENQIPVYDIGDEKEEGELEEGEIDLDSETQTQTDSEVRDLETRVKSVLQVLETITVVEAQKCFEGVSSRLLVALESLQKLISDSYDVPKRDILIQLSFAALQTLYSVFSFMSNILKEQNKETVSRLLSLVKSHFSMFLSPNQIREIEGMLQSLSSSCFVINAGIGDGEKERLKIDVIGQHDYDALAGTFDHASAYGNNLSIASESFLSSKSKIPLEASKWGASSMRSRTPLLPLLDLHKDHDADSLPSPTRETTPSLPVNRPLSVGQGLTKSDSAMGKAGQGVEGAKMHPYENEALKAVSSYQQKFGRNSLFTMDRLPSPTPSEESNDGNGDVGGEVSSSVLSNPEPVNLPISGQPVVSPSSVNIATLPAPSVTPISAVQSTSTSTPVAPPNSVSNAMGKITAKSRDPRLRFANSDGTVLDANQNTSQMVHSTPMVESSGVLMASRKQKSVDEVFIDGPALKRQKNGVEDRLGARNLQKVSGSGGWLEDSDTYMSPSHLTQKAQSDPRKMENGLKFSTTTSVKPSTTIATGETISVAASPIAVSLPSLLKEIAVNPTMLLNFFKMGAKQRVTESTQQKPTDPRKAAQLPGSNSLLGAVPPASVSPSNPSVILPRPGGIPQVPSQAVPSVNTLGGLQDESGKIRMKPRDPRRVLHGSGFQRSGSLVEEQSKGLEPPTSGTYSLKGKIEGQTEAKPVLSQLVPLQDVNQSMTNNLKNVADLVGRKPPDIAPQFTENLKNIADLMAVSQVGNPPISPQNPPPQLVQLKGDTDLKRIASNSGNQRNGTGLASAVDAAGPARAMNSWEDVEHLLEGYDDKQKAAIQRERARRLEEQKKMFAERKLCLVLDLDHTLLNSAKFNEVDPVHDEILRRKEEQDREKPHRHLFRFQHMGMWTKLRPGVWNFLEKASKLYELHLYTMGNKLYATEMAKVLDPKGTLFNGRVISRGDDGDPFDGDERVPKSKDLEGVLGMESSVVIIDDSVRVWPHNKMNLIVVERYTYFPCSRRQFGLLGPSLLEIDHDERPEDGTLASSLAVIERIHQNFFSHPLLDEADVRSILAEEQRKILAGCRIVFSRVFPVGEANPHLHPLWQTAEQFGAACTTQIDDNVTHVVANSLGTDKVNWALTRGRFVVHTGWVEASALLYRRANENDFAIKP